MPDQSGSKSKPFKWSDFLANIMAIFVMVMAAFYFCDRFVPSIKAWAFSLSHCPCSECESIRDMTKTLKNSVELFEYNEGVMIREIEGQEQRLRQLEQATRVPPVPIPNAQLQPRPLPPIQPPAI